MDIYWFGMGAIAGVIVTFIGAMNTIGKENFELKGRIKMDEKRKKLQRALEVERAQLPNHNIFGEKTNFDDYAHAIWYLGCGEYEEIDIDDNPLLESVVNDFDNTYSDYFG